MELQHIPSATLKSRLMTLPDEAVMKVLALVMAETLAAGSSLVEAASAVIKPDTRQWRAADDTFLDLVRDRPSINSLLCWVAGKAIADANISETAKVQRKILRDFLTGEGRDASGSKVSCRATNVCD